MSSTTHPFPNASASFLRLNPRLCGLRADGGAKPQPPAAAALDSHAPGRQAGADGVGGSGAATGGALRVVLVAHLPRHRDRDNLVAGLKPLQDAICASLGIDDGEEDRIRFDVGQVETPGPEGVMVAMFREAEARPNEKADR